MKFTLVFSSGEPADLSIGMVFIPCATWVQGKKTILVPNRKTPHYESGYLRRLLEVPTIAKQTEWLEKNLVVVVHPDGHGSARDLERLIQDCQDEGFSVQKIELPA